MNRDPIIDQLHQIKDAEALEHGNCVRRLAEALKSRRTDRGQSLVRYPPHKRYGKSSRRGNSGTE